MSCDFIRLMAGAHKKETPPEGGAELPEQPPGADNAGVTHENDKMHVATLEHSYGYGDRIERVKFSRDVITVIRDPRSYLGKKFALTKDGTVKKGATVDVAEGLAVMHHVPDGEALRRLLLTVANDAHAAITPSVFNGLEIGEEFVVMSEDQIRKRLGLRHTDRSKTQGVHLFKVDGVERKVVGRLKENIAASTWQLLDRDVDEFTPAEHAADNFDAWLAKVDILLPGVLGAELLRAPSVSARVMKDGAAVGGGNGHTWVRFADPDDVERVRVAMPVRAAQHGLTWLKPRFSRKTGEQLGKGMMTTIIDFSVFTPGRLVFVGKPVVSHGLTVAEPDLKLLPALDAETLDSHLADMPDREAVKEITRAAGCELHVSSDGKRIRVDAFDLRLDTELETQSNGVMTVREAMALGKPLRCQAPMRASVSFAGKLNFSPAQDRRPFVHDVGTGVNHWLCDEDWEFAKPKVALDFPIWEKSPDDLDLPPFDRQTNGKIKPSRGNLAAVLMRPDLCGAEIRYDTFLQHIMIAPKGSGQWRKFADTDYTALCKHLESGDQGFTSIAATMIREMVHFVAHEQAFDSAQDWLNGLVWDGVPRVETFYIDHARVEDTPYHRAVARYTWTGLAGRVLVPGIKADMAPVLAGPQGAGKSSLIKAMAPGEEMFGELDLGHQDDDLGRHMAGKLVIELGELKGLRKKEQESLKAFIARQVDSRVPKYMEHAVDQPRRNLLFGTTNESQFLEDPTGHRRWLPMTVPARDSPTEVEAMTEAVAAARDQLWAEGAALFKASGIAWKDAEYLAKAEHSQFEVTDSWTGAVHKWLEFEEAWEDNRVVRRKRDNKPFTAVDVLVGAIGMAQDKVNEVARKRVAGVLRQLGYVSKRTMVNGLREHFYTRGK